MKGHKKDRYKLNLDDLYKLRATPCNRATTSSATVDIDYTAHNLFVFSTIAFLLPSCAFSFGTSQALVVPTTRTTVAPPPAATSTTTSTLSASVALLESMGYPQAQCVTVLI